MSRTTYEYFGQLATTALPSSRIAGRYSVQTDAERLIPMDVAQKLELNPSDRLLDIGCGPGTNLIPLSFLVQSAVGIDHPRMIQALSSRVNLQNVEFVPGNFLDLELGKRFTKIVAYSVVQCLASEEEAVTFIQRACDLLEIGGRLLIGDLPNTGLRSRFHSSAGGKEFQAEWNRRMALASAVEDTTAPLVDANLFLPDDAAIVRLISKFRSSTTHAWILPQRTDLPFGHTREDLLITKL